MIFHRHKWELTHAQFTPPYHGLRKVEGASAEFLLGMTLGVTTFIERCERCGKYNIHRAYGRIEEKACV